MKMKFNGKNPAFENLSIGGKREARVAPEGVRKNDGMKYNMLVFRLEEIPSGF